jgi:hypothetical protein
MKLLPAILVLALPILTNACVQVDGLLYGAFCTTFYSDITVVDNGELICGGDGSHSLNGRWTVDCADGFSFTVPWPGTPATYTTPWGTFVFDLDSDGDAEGEIYASDEVLFSGNAFC